MPPDQCCSPGCDNDREEGWLYCEPCLYDQGYRRPEEALAAHPLSIAIVVTAAVIAWPFVNIYRWIKR